MLEINLNFPDPISDETHFFGRDEVWKQVQWCLWGPNPRPIIVLGERYIGKTSLLRVSIQRMKSFSESHLIPILLPSGSKLSSYNSLTTSIYNSLQTAINEIQPKNDSQKTVRVQQSVPVHQFIKRLEELISGFHGKTLVLCLDDFDSILQPLIQEGSEQEIKSIIDLIDALIMERRNLQITLFITASKIPEVLRKSGILTEFLSRHG